MRTFIINDSKGVFYEITSLIPETLKCWEDKYKESFTEKEVIEVMMEELNGNRFIQYSKDTTKSQMSKGLLNLP